MHLLVVALERTSTVFGHVNFFLQLHGLLSAALVDSEDDHGEYNEHQDQQTNSDGSTNHIASVGGVRAFSHARRSFRHNSINTDSGYVNIISTELGSLLCENIFQSSGNLSSITNMFACSQMSINDDGAFTDSSDFVVNKVVAESFSEGLGKLKYQIGFSISLYLMF